MKRVCGFVLLFGSFAAAQCTALVPGPGTACVGPIWAYDKVPTTQSSIILVDIGLPSEVPAANKYILSFSSGTFQVSENGGPYHTLVGPKGDKGDPGTAATVSVGTVTSGPTPSVTNSGDAQNAVLNFTLQQGPKGVPGIVVGNTITATEVCNIVSGVRTCKLKVLAIQ